MRKILFISTRYPFPIFGGDKLRLFSILKFLSKKNQVDLACLGKRDEISKKIAFCRNTKVFHLGFLPRIINTIFSFLNKNYYILLKKLKK